MMAVTQAGGILKSLPIIKSNEHSISIFTAPNLFLLCPMSANTTAKIPYGIANLLLINAVSQAAKARLPIYLCPADQYVGSISTMLPDGKELTLYMRDVDMENSNRLKRIQGVTVLKQIKEIEDVIKRHVENLN
ncbi:MAG: flavoprotein [Euryarchaeota archaeon]|nr:flavoprotein [Euryarchaeota archaeon]